MSTKTASLSAYSIQAAKANTAYGMLSVLPVQAAKSAVLFRASLSGIPREATVTSAKVQFWTSTAFSGSTTVNIAEITSAWSTSQHWANRPNYSSSPIASVSLSSPGAGALVELDITASAQAMVSGSKTNRGWQITSTSSSLLRLAGVWAKNNKPKLVVEYSMLPDAPDNPHPGAGNAVSIAKPTLSFTGVDDMTALQIQVDPSMNGTTPAFDSGTVAATAGLLDLTQTTYAGLAPGAMTYWRARQKNGYGWGPWSPWYGFKRVAKGTVTIVNPPSGTVTDGSPPIEWSFSGVQTAWSVAITDKATGKVLASSGAWNGTPTSWDPPTGLTKDGQVGTIQVAIWDDQDRSDSPGDPVYAVGTIDVTLNLDATVSPMDTLTATPGGVVPNVTLTGTRAAGIPDEVIVYRNSVQVARMPGTDVFTGTSFTITDWGTQPNVPTTYRVAPVVNGAIAKGGPSKTVTPTIGGIWIISMDDPSQRAVLWTGDAQEQTQPELSVVHTPAAAADGTVQVVRRRLNRMPPQGTLSGNLIDGAGQTAADSEAALRTWADPDQTDASALFRVIMGNQNVPAIIGDINLSERPDNFEGQRTVDVTLNWYGRAV